MKKRIFHYVIVTVLALLVGPGTGNTAGPWQWQFSLNTEGPEGVMQMPTGLFVDSGLKRYYVVDAGNNRLLSFDQEGKFLNAFNAENSLQIPFDMAREEGGIIWVVEKGRNSLTSIDLKTKDITVHTLFAHQKPVYPDRLQLHNDLFYILDKATGAVVAYDKNLAMKRKFACSDCTTGFIDFEATAEQLWALEPHEPAVYRFNKTGVLEERIPLAGSISFPYSLAVGQLNQLFVLDRHAGTVAVFSDQGEFQYDFLHTGQGRGQLYFPTEITFDPWGRLCVVEEGNGRVQIFSRQ
jgi:DNA-binding beta-propeller fold protein YncE